MDIEELEEIRRSVLAELKSIEGDIRDYWLDKHKENHGIYVGAAVKTTAGKFGIITSVDAREALRGSKPWVKARLYKKDGELSKLTKNLLSGSLTL